MDTFCGRLKPKPTGETAEAIKEEEARGILSRALAFVTASMQARCISFSVAELEAQPELCRGQLSEHLWKYASVSMNNAVVAPGGFEFSAERQPSPSTAWLPEVAYDAGAIQLPHLG